MVCFGRSVLACSKLAGCWTMAMSNAGGTRNSRRCRTSRLGVFDSVDVGNGHACGVRPVGKVECWGRHAGTALEAPDAEFLSVSAGSGRTCGITHDRQVVCWGKSFQ